MGRLTTKQKEDSKLEHEKRRMKIKCPYCGTRIHFYAFEDKTKQLCDICGRYVFKNKQEEFKYRLKENMKKVNK